MGREWLWRSSSGSGTSSSLAKGDCKESSNAAPPGCMSGVLHYLHFHHLLFDGGSRSPPASPSPSLSLSSAPLPPRVDLARHEQLKGFEAPRNSVELDEGIKAMSSSTAASAMEDEFYDVPVPIEISSREEKGSSQQQAVTPRSSTPGIVARLMGLEISLDNASSPTPKMTPPQPQALGSKKKKSKKSFDGDLQCCAMREHDSPSPRQPLRSLDRNAAAASSVGLFGITSDGAGSRSLPETPRVSSSSGRSCDEYPRLSLQLNKENYMTGEYHSLPPSPSAYTAVKTKKRELRRHQDENKSPRSRHYAREIVEQTKETITSRRGDGSRLDEIKSKSKRTRKTTTEKKKLSMGEAPSPPPQPMALSNNTDEGTKKPLETTKMVLNKCKKADNERFTERIRRQETQAPTTLASLFRSADMLSADKNLNPDKNQSRPVSSAYSVNSPTRSSTPTLGVAMQQSSYQKKRQGQGQERIWKRDDPEFRYIKSIFERAGIAGVRSLRWSSPLLPVDPIIFDELELRLPLFTGNLRFRWNRKLMFYLVEEILGDLLLSYSELLPSSAITHLDKDERFTISNINAEALLRRVWGQIQSFPAEGNDLHALISRDLPEANVRRLLRHPSVVEEAEDVVFEVEREILDGLLGDTAASFAISSSSQGGGGGGGVHPRRNLSQYCRCVWSSARM